MKKSIILAAAVAALLMFASSCQKEEFVNEPAATGDDLVFTATIDNSATKTTIDAASTGKVSWVAGDSITIGTNKIVYVATPDASDASKATFAKKYESDADPMQNGEGKYEATYGSEPLTAQTYSADVTDLPMTATSETTSLTFSVTCGLLKLHLTKTGESIKRIAVTGTPTGGTETTYTLACPENEGTEEPVSIDNEGADFFIALPAGTYTKFRITDLEGKVCTINGSTGVTITANEIQPLSFSERLTFTGGYLCFTAKDDGLQMTLNTEGSPTTNTLEYSTDGSSWTDITIDTEFPGTALNNGGKVYVRAKTDRSDEQDDENYIHFTGSADYEVSGNIMYLVDSEGGNSYTMNAYEFYALFYEEDEHHLLSAENLTLPATTLADDCYEWMFYQCTALTQAPALPATTLAKYCYYEMFYDCQSLTTAPALPASTMVKDCYMYMFEECSNLKSAPELPATALAEGCYDGMFYGCTSLTEAPALPATTLADYCYGSMFCGCESLTQAPVLPATTLAEYCYYAMFYYCTTLTEAPALPATTLAPYCYYDMFEDCEALTTAPVLPATTLAEGCYKEMFQHCTSLTEAPVLSATTLVKQCYYEMFNGCSSLNAVTCLATEGFKEDECLFYWLSGVAASGTFTKASSMTGWTTESVSGIPSGWTIKELPTIGIAKAKLDGTNEVDVTWVQLWENGPKWATINVGVTDPDATGDALYGGLYRWGGTNNMRSNTSATADNNTGSADLSNTSNPITDTATKLWGNNWRMPTQAELQDLKTKCTWSASSAGCTVTGKGNYATSRIFLPFAGYFDHDSKTVSSAGTFGDYWSSTYYDDDGANENAYDMYFNSGNPSVNNPHNRKYGYSVRAVLVEAE